MLSLCKKVVKTPHTSGRHGQLRDTEKGQSTRAQERELAMKAQVTKNARLPSSGDLSKCLLSNGGVTE